MVAQTEVKQANPVTSGIASRLASKEERSLKTKAGKEGKRQNDNTKETEAGSHQAVKKRRSDSEKDQKKREEIAELEELLEKKKKELDLVSSECQVPQEKFSSSGEISERKKKNNEKNKREKAWDVKGRKDSKPNGSHEVSKKENLTRSQINLSWTDGESGEEGGGGSNIKSSISFSQSKGQTSVRGRKERKEAEDITKGTFQSSRKDRFEKGSRRVGQRKPSSEERKRSTKRPEIKSRKKLEKASESGQRSNPESVAKGRQEKGELERRSQEEPSLNPTLCKFDIPSTSTEPSTTTSGFLADLPTSTSSSSSPYSKSSTFAGHNHFSKASSNPSLFSSGLASSTTENQNIPKSSRQISTWTNSQKEQNTRPDVPVPSTSQSSASTKPNTSVAVSLPQEGGPTRHSVEEKKLEEELEEAMEWEEVGVEEAVQASHRVRELLKEEQMEGVEEEGEQEEEVMDGQQGKLVMVVDTNVLLSNGFPLVQELIQRGLCTIFLPWQVKVFKTLNTTIQLFANMSL